MNPPTTAAALSTPPPPLVRSCRDVITHAGGLASVLLCEDGLRHVPASLAEPITALLDAVMDLDYRTGFLGTGAIPPPL